MFEAKNKANLLHEMECSDCVFRTLTCSHRRDGGYCETEIHDAANLIESMAAELEQVKTQLADYEKAIEEGRMVILPCKPGDDLYWLDDADPATDEEPGWKVKCDKKGVGAVVVRGKDDFAIISDDGIEEIGSRWAYLTEADAQAALERMENDG